MTDYTKNTNFTAKDALPTGDPGKLIKGSLFDSEFDEIATASATKFDSGDIASQAQAEAETSDAVVMTPLRTAQWADANGGIVGDLQALADPDADQFLIWDDSATASVGMPLASDSGLAISATPDVQIDVSALGSSLTGAGIAGADLLLIDDGAGGTNKKVAYQDFGVPTTTDSTTTPMSAADLTFANRFYILTNAAAISFVIPANASVAYPVGTTFIIFQSGAGQVTVSVTTDTLRSPNGAKTASQYSVIQVVKTTSTEWVVFGDTTS